MQQAKLRVLQFGFDWDDIIGRLVKKNLRVHLSIDQIPYIKRLKKEHKQTRSS